MSNQLALPLLKERLGIKTDARNTYLKAIIDGATKELEDEKGLALDESNPYHLLFVIDYAAWKFEDPKAQSMPRNLQFRLHNLIIHVGNQESGDVSV